MVMFAEAGTRPLRVYSWNVNGLRSAGRKGFVDALQASEADIFLVQESRAFARDLSQELREPHGYASFLFPAAKPGYSGVALYVRSALAPELALVQGLGAEDFDAEGRWLEARFERWRLVVVSAYFPNSQWQGARLAFKLDFCRRALARMQALVKEGWQVVLGGDINIAHEERDLANPKANTANPGFLPEERAWFSELVGAAGFVDTFRTFESGNGHYTWWSARAGVRERNVGWRIDYQIVSPGLAARVAGSRIHAGILGSDHCPVSLDLML